MSEKWTLAEAKEKLFGREPELEDLGVPARQLTFDVSIAEGSDADGEGLSVILTPSDIEDEDEDESWTFSYLVHYREGVSKQELVEIIANTLGIKPDERVWQNGEEL